MNSFFIYFDLGGVMFQYDGGLVQLAKENGVTLEDFNRVFRKYEYAVAIGEMTLQELWEKYVLELGLQRKKNFDFLDYWVNHFVPIYPTHALVKEVAKKFPIGILSNLYAGTFKKIKEKNYIPLLEYAAIIQSCEVHCAKPQEAIYTIAQQAARVRPHNILFIDDKQEDIVAAQRLGWNTVHFDSKNPHNSIEKIRKLLYSPGF